MFDDQTDAFERLVTLGALASDHVQREAQTIQLI